MKDILFITHFTRVPGEKGNGRFHYIAENIEKNNATIEVLTSSYAHKGKKQRILTEQDYNNISYKLTLIHEPGYKKNVSIKRLYSHRVFARNLKKHLKNREVPDVIYCSIPSVDAAYVAAKYARKHNVKFIIDVQDLWPEAFKMLLKNKILSNILFYPMQHQANYAYKSADVAVGVSESYARRPLKVNNRLKNYLAIPLGTDLSYFDKLANENYVKKSNEHEIWLCYLGTLGHAYDIKTVIDSLVILQKRGITNIKFKVLGDGPLKTEFENYAKHKNVDVDFKGRLDYERMVGELMACDITVNPISKGAVASLINKHADYAASGLPVLNTQESEEYINLITEYNCGFNSESKNPISLANNLEKLVKDSPLRKEMGMNSRKLAERMFDRKETYVSIYNTLLK